MLLRVCLKLIAFAVLVLPAHADSPIPYRYSIQEGFILAVDDASSRSVEWNDAVAVLALERLAAILESDRYRVPVQWGRTLAWHTGRRIGERMSRDEHLSIYRDAVAQDASRAQPGHVLFINLRERDSTYSMRIDWLDLTRGERETRYAADGLEGDNPDALDAFFRDVADDILDRLGPAPPTPRGDVPPAWLIEPVEYRIDLTGFSDTVAADIIDALTLDLDHYIGAQIDDDGDDRITIQYQTQAPSWWIADRIYEVMNEYDLEGEIEPRRFGLRLRLAE